MDNQIVQQVIPKKLKSMKAGTNASKAAVYIVLTVLAIIWLIPIAMLVIHSFRLEKGAIVLTTLPINYTLDNYIRLFTETGLFNYPRWLINTAIVGVASCLLSTLYVLMISFAFSRLRFKSRTKLMKLGLILNMFPGFMAMVAVYFILKAFGLTQTLLALVLVYSSTAALGYYIVKGFFDTIPRALDEAAMIDGATKAQVFWKIIIPLSKPIIVYTVLMAFMAPWVDFIFVSVIMGDNYNNYTVALGLFQMLKRETIYEYFTQFCAGAVVVSIPIAGLFMIMQRFYVSGITGGAVKG